MGLIVQKFGGSSVATAERIMAAARRALQARRAGHQVIVVVSARGDTTDELIALAREISEHPPAREMDMLLATGEQISIALMAMAIQALGQPALSFTGAQIGIVTDSFHTKARIRNISTQRIRQALDQKNVVIVAGFQGIDEHYNITTLGRGGSDTTAVALAAVLKRESRDGAVDCEIYTDVDGVYTTDPRLVAEARKLDALSYDEMLELASVGASVMHSRSIEFAKKYDVPLHVRSSFTDAPGTWILPEADWMRDIVVCGAALVKDEARVNLEGIPDLPGVAQRVFESLAEAQVVVDMIAQNASTAGRAAIGFTVLGNELPHALAVLEPLVQTLGGILRHEKGVSKVSVVGTGMRTHAGVAERMFATLAAEGINVQMITTGDIKISVLVDHRDGLRALRAVHEAFELGILRPAGSLPRPQAGYPRRPRPAAGEVMAHEPIVAHQPSAGMEDIVVSDIFMTTDQGRVTVFGLPDRPGNCSRLFQAVAAAGIVVDLIVQNLTADGRAELTFSVPCADVPRTQAITADVARLIDPEVRVAADAEIAKLFVLGVGMRTHTGVARRAFAALAQRDINVCMISTSEVRFCVVVERRRADEALACLRQAFTP